ncbi:Uncharacterised protein [Bordetella pertussis]|nr:Uncharacterised protein [Bordetella pertussis]
MRQVRQLFDAGDAERIILKMEFLDGAEYVGTPGAPQAAGSGHGRSIAFIGFDEIEPESNVGGIDGFHPVVGMIEQFVQRRIFRVYCLGQPADTHDSALGAYGARRLVRRVAVVGIEGIGIGVGVHRKARPRHRFFP